jgi:trehalose-6-phosphatase
MVAVEDYVARTEGTCGEEKDVIVLFKYGKKDEAIRRILERAKTEKSISGIIFEMTFKKASFRVYASGKAIFRNLKSEAELKNLLSDLLL